MIYLDPPKIDPFKAPMQEHATKTGIAVPKLPKVFEAKLCKKRNNIHDKSRGINLEV